MILKDPYPRFQGHTIFDAEYLSNGTTYIVSLKYWTYTRLTQQCRFESSDFEWLS